MIAPADRFMRQRVLTFFVAVTCAAFIRAAEADFPPKPPKFILKPNLNEIFILNVSEMDGLLKYGGSGDFQLKMAKEGSNVVWNVTVDNPRLMELLGIFVGEKTMKLVQSLDPNNLDPNQKIVLEAIKPLNFSHIVVGRVTPCAP